MTTPRASAAFLAAAWFLLSPVPALAESFEWTDEDKDGRKETQVFSEGGKKVRAEADMNGDGKTDRWVRYENGVKFSGENDTDGDGKIDVWNFYSREGLIGRTAKDTDKNGKPDAFTTLLQGRQVVMKEKDRNGDGKIDKRQLCEWGVNKSPAGLIPGHKPVWTEQDDDYDGKVDKSVNKADKAAARARLGKPLDGRLTAFPDDPRASGEGAEKYAPASQTQGGPAKRVSRTEARVAAMNVRHGFEDGGEDSE